MKKRFKGKKNKKNIFIYILFFIVIILVVVCLTFNYLYDSLTKNLSEQQLISILLDDTKTNTNKILKNNGISFLLNYSFGIDIDLPVSKKNVEQVTPAVIIENNDNNSEPLVYIYNTHQTEEYRKTNNNEYNIVPTVLHASLILQNKLSDLGISSIVEKNNIKEILDINNWSYKNSYKASKLLALDALDKNKSIKYVIDLHRDSIPENISKCEIDGKTYAKIMIVLGKGHDGFERNLEMANRINNYLKEFNPSITRGIDIKNNSGIFNQDISNNAVLIEVGGPYNDIKSISNSLEALANVYKRIVDEDNEKEKE